MKYPSERATIFTVKADQKTTRECYTAGLKLYPRSTRQKAVRSEVAMADLDLHTNTDDRIKSIEELCPVKVGKEDGQTTTWRESWSRGWNRS